MFTILVCRGMENLQFQKPIRGENWLHFASERALKQTLLILNLINSSF